MPRTARIAPGGMIFHVLNRGVGRTRLFSKDDDFEAFERIIERTLETSSMRICAYCLMSHHWHFVLWPERTGDLGAFLQKLTVTHVRNWQVGRRRGGPGSLYQSRFKSFPVESDEHFYQVVRYVERNALRADLVARPEDWRWSSLWRRVYGTREERRRLSKWPLPQPRAWVDLVSQPQAEEELEAIRLSVIRGRPYGNADWVRKTAKRLGLESTLRPRGRPRTVAS